jgi:hypothetical protein
VGAYEDLSADHDFCESLGRMTLAAARLESDLRAFLLLNNVRVSENATLGGLVAALKREGFVSANADGILRTHTKQRNYLTHSLYDLFTARIDEGLMYREDLEDTSLLTDRAFVLEDNLRGLAETAERRIGEFQRGELERNPLLFRP